MNSIIDAKYKLIPIRIKQGVCYICHKPVYTYQRRLLVQDKMCHEKCAITKMVKPKGE